MAVCETDFIPHWRSKNSLSNQLCIKRFLNGSFHCIGLFHAIMASSPTTFKNFFVIYSNQLTRKDVAVFVQLANSSNKKKYGVSDSLFCGIIIFIGTCSSLAMTIIFLTSAKLDCANSFPSQ